MSKNHDKVKQHFNKGYWPLEWVYEAVGLWITADEFQEITGEKFEEKE